MPAATLQNIDEIVRQQVEKELERRQRESEIPAG